MEIIGLSIGVGMITAFVIVFVGMTCRGIYYYIRRRW